jgi:uncharacterized RDD family membrane protein YckC
MPLTEPSADPEEAAREASSLNARRRAAYAGFWLRAVAYLIDTFLLGILVGLTILMPLIARGAIPADNPWYLFTATGRQVIAIQLLVAMAQWLYFASFESSRWQATPGKRALGLVVTDLAGRRVSFARASGRNLGKHISEFIFMLGFAMAGFTVKKQALHDMMASCLVLRKI